MNPPFTRPSDSGHDSHYLRPESRRPVSRRRSRRGWRRVAAVSLRLALVAGAVGGASAGLERFVNSGTFAVRDISVEGCTHARPEEIRARLDPVAGSSLFALDLDRVSDMAGQAPWVRSVEVRRRLPGTLQLAIEEREPAGVAAVDSHVMLVDEEGAVLAECGAVSVPCDGAVIRGLDGLPAQEQSRRISTGVAALSEIRRVSPKLAGHVSEITVTPDAVRLQTDDGGPPILLHPSQFGRNLENYASAEDRIRAGWNRLDYVDLRFRGLIAVLPAGAMPPPAADPATARPSAGPSVGDAPRPPRPARRRR